MRLAAGKSRAGWRERWGYLPAALAHKGHPRIWVHAASVGEVMAAVPVLKSVHERLPEHEMVLSVITPGGYETAQALEREIGSTTVYAPFDAPWAVSRAAGTIQPDVLVVLETELWPNLLHAARRAGARLLLINGRISDRSLGRYMMFRGLFAWALGRFDRILAQTPRDAERFRAIGGPPDRIEVVGNAKFDQAAEQLADDEAGLLRRSLMLPNGVPILVVGSTRTPEEERQVIRAYQQARKEVPSLALIHAPRHVERAAELADLMRAAGLSPVRRTELDGIGQPVQQLVLDTYGELARVYALADVAFIGNSLVHPGGGQNLLQPLAQGKPVVFGPYMQNFRDLAEMAIRAGVGFRVATAEDLAQRVVDLIRNTAAPSIRQNALAMVDANRGAADRYADAIVAAAQSRALASAP